MKKWTAWTNGSLRFRPGFLELSPTLPSVVITPICPAGTTNIEDSPTITATNAITIATEACIPVWFGEMFLIGERVIHLELLP